MTTELKSPSWPCNQLGKISPAVLTAGFSRGASEAHAWDKAQLRTDELHGTLMR